MMRKIGNRGEDRLMNNVLSVIIFVISFALIVYGIYKVYNVFTNQDIKNAQNTLDKIDTKISAIDAGEKSSVTIQGFRDSESWALFSWDKDASADSKPDKCYFESCICLCKSTATIWKLYIETSDARLSSCKQTNMCKTFEQSSISILDKNGQPKFFAGTQYYILPESLDELLISKSENGESLTIQHGLA